MIDEKYIVHYKGKPHHYVNPALLVKQGKEGNLDAIKALHVERLVIMDKMKKSKSIKNLRKMNASLFELEGNLQDLWGFALNPNYVKFWNFPQCECPKVDNNDNYPIGYYTINGNCKLHGNV